MARPCAFNKDAVVDAAMKQFWRQGYGATSVADLTAATQLLRGSLYNAFGDKRGLFLLSLDHYLDEVVYKRTAAVARATSPLKGIRAFFDDLVDFAMDDGKGLGCLLVKTATESREPDPEVDLRLIKGRAHLENTFREALSRAVEAGDVALDTECPRMARYIVDLLTGFMMLSLSGDRGRLVDYVDIGLSVLRPTSDGVRR